MDAAQTIFKKLVFFFTTALCLIAPLRASTAPTLQVSANTVQIGNATCNDFTTVTVTSSVTTSPITFQVAVQYTSGDPNPYRDWIYATVQNAGSTNGSNTFTTSTGTGGVTLTIGLDNTQSTVADNANVILTDTGNSADTQTILVQYQQNNSCGNNSGSVNNGTLSITPGSVTLSSSQLTQVLGITNLTGNPLTFTVTQQEGQSAGSWLSTSFSTNSITANGSGSVTVTANPSNATQTGNLTGTVVIQAMSGTAAVGTALSIPVTYSSSSTGTGGGGGSSGTLTLNNTTSNVYNTTFTYTGTAGGQCVPLQDTVSGTDSYTFTVSESSGGYWLLADNQPISPPSAIVGSLTPGSNACVELTLSNAVNGLTSGVYQGSVAITSASGSTATINVNLYVSDGAAPDITVSPGLVYLFPNVAVGANVVQDENFTITASNNVGLGSAAPVSPEASWFEMTTPSAAGSTENFTVTANSTGLSAGVYSQVVTMQSTGTSNVAGGQTYILVVLPVGQSGTQCSSNCGGGTGSVTSAVEPSSLQFQAQQGNSYYTSAKEGQDITITGQQGTTWSASITYGTGTGWLTFDSPSQGSGTFGSGPATLVVDLNNGGVSQLTPSATPYTATVAITTPSGTSNVAVSVLVTNAGTPVLVAYPASTTFAYSSNGTTPSPQTVLVDGTDNPGSTSTPVITAGTPTASWILTTTSGNTLTLSVNPSGLATGVYFGTVQVSTTAYSNNLIYPVVLVVNGGGSGTTSSGPLTLSQSAFVFTNVTGQLSQNLTVTASTLTNFTVVSSETLCTGNTWLTVANGSYEASATATNISVTVNPSGIANGTTCTGVITLVSPTATQTVNVSMAVGVSASGGNVTVNQTAVSFNYTQNQTVPSAVNVTVVNQSTTNTAGIPFTVAVSETNGTSTNWLLVSASSATTPYTTPYNNPGLAISVAPASLSPGTYTGTVTVTPTGGTAVPITVTLVVTGSAVVTATPTTVNLTYQVGGSSPTSTIQVSAGGSSAGFTAVASSSNNFLVVSPTSGTTPNTGTVPLTVSVSPSVLSGLLPSSTPYTGTITVSGTSPATGSTVVQVSLTVSAPLPVISSINNAASGASGTISPGEIISIFGSNIGPATSVSNTSSTQVPSTLGNVQVKFLPSGLNAPLLYVSSGQINAVVPYGVAGLASLTVEVVFLGQTSQAQSVTLAPTAPGIFTQNGSGTGPAAVNGYSASGTFLGEVNPSNPVAPGGYLVVYMTGEGLVTPTPTSGAVTVASNTTPITPVPGYAPTVLIGNQPATVLYYGEAAGFVSGVLQINVQVPANVAAGAQSLSVSIGPNASQAGVTVSIQ